MLSAQEQTLSGFFAAAATGIFGLLVLLAAEARGVGEDLRSRRAGTDASLQPQRLPKASFVPVAIVLLGGEIAALHVLAQGHADRWQPVVIWAALAVGLVSVTISVVLAVSTVKHGVARSTRLMWLRWWGPSIVGVAVGFVASPLALGDRGSGVRFTVYGTCLDGGCGLVQRTGPAAHFPENKARHRLADGTRIEIVCQTKGSPPRGYNNRVWDKLTNGHFVSDAFVDTPNRSGGFSEEIPRC